MRKIKTIAIAILIITVAMMGTYMGATAAGTTKNENWYQKYWCLERRGQSEVTMPDGATRCDCLTSQHAIEFDFGPKWAEAIGQSLYYALQTGKRAGIVLILKKPVERRYWIRLNTVIDHFKMPIDAWKIETWENGPQKAP